MYEVKFKDTAGQGAHYVVEGATDVVDAVAAVMATGDLKSVGDVHSCHLSRFREAYPLGDGGGPRTFYKVVAYTYDTGRDGKERKVKSLMLVEAADHSRACARTYEILRQGYDMETFSVGETRIDAVIQWNGKAAGAGQ